MAKTSKSKYSVYLIRCLPNGKVYVGLTSGSVLARFARHKRQAKAGSQCLIHRAMLKHGFENFECQVLVAGLSCQEACEIEVDEIASRGAAGAFGYNILAGGQSGVSLRPDLTRARRSEAAKKAWHQSQKWQASIYNPSRLRAISEASKKNFEDKKYRSSFEARHAKMIDLAKQPSARRRANLTFRKNGHSVAVRCSNGMIFEAASDAVKWLNFNFHTKAAVSNILKCARGARKTAYGYSWGLLHDNCND